MSKFDEYLNCKCCQDILSTEYSQVIDNIIEDDETFITESMKIELFSYLMCHDGNSSIMNYFDDFFDNPINKDLSDKLYLLKGKVVDLSIYGKNLGRVSSISGFMRSLKAALSKLVVPSSDIDDEAFIEYFMIEPQAISSTPQKIFLDYINDIGIADFKIQEYPMWTFDGFFDEDVFKGYEIKDLPCILGLPGPMRTAIDYDKIPRMTFSFSIPNNIVVRKPTSFDAGYMPVWRIGGKTKVHNEGIIKYGEFGFEEYIHEPILYKDIISQLIKL